MKSRKRNRKYKTEIKEILNTTIIVDERCKFYIVLESKNGNQDSLTVNSCVKPVLYSLNLIDSLIAIEKTL